MLSLSNHRRWRAFVAAMLLAEACRLAGPPPAIDPLMASYVPEDTVVLAGLNLSQIRSSPAYAQLPPMVAPFVENYRDATHLLVAFNGKEVLLIALGSFHAAPPGATLLDSHLALYGSDASVRAAIAQHKRSAGTGRLLSYAASIAPGKPIWMVAPGGVELPLSGNATNLKPILRKAEFVAVTATLGAQSEIDATVVGRDTQAGYDVEQNLRTALAMAIATTKRGSDAAALLAAVQIRREDRTVHATVSAGADSLGKLMDQLGR